MIHFFLLLLGFANAGPYIGCFSDNAISYVAGPIRDVSVLQTARNAYTATQCVATCTAQGFFYAGSQNGNECYCGNTYGSYCLGVTNACRSACGLNSSEICGGVNYNSVYVANPGGPGQSSTCNCGTPNGCAAISSTITAFGCATAQDASTIDFTVSVNGGVAPISYKLNNGLQTANTLYSVATEGTYTVTAVDINGAVVTGSVFAGPAKKVIATPIPFVPYGTLAGYRTSAVGSVDGTVSANSTGGSGNIKFTLYPPSSAIAFQGVTTGIVGKFGSLPAGNFNLIATDATGCRSTPVPIVVNTPTLAAAPTGISASEVNINQKPFASVSWIAPDFNGYTPITGYAVSIGYWDGVSSIVWNINTTVTTTTVSIADVMNDSTRRFVSIATLNAVGKGAYSSAIEFVGLCAAGRFANSSACQDCSAGTNTVGTIGRSVCRACLAGTYSGPAAPVCTSCSGNTYSGSGASSCSPCGPGYFTGSYYCQPCAPGTYNAGSATSCSQCPANTFANQPGSAACTACPPGTNSAQGAAQCQDATGYKK